MNMFSAVSVDGTLYVVAGAEAKVRIYAPDVWAHARGQELPFVAEFATASNGDAIALDSNAKVIYVAHLSDNSVGVYAGPGYYPAGTGTVGTLLGKIRGPKTQLNRPSSIAVDGTGRLYVARCCTYEASITVFDPGTAGYGDIAPIARIAGSNADFGYTTTIAVDGSGKLYVSNYVGGNHPKTEIKTFAQGATGNVAPISTLTFPGGPAPCIAVH
jgi:hypothetical protein